MLKYGKGQWNQVQNKIDDVIRQIFRVTLSVAQTDQLHPATKELLHPNAGWSLNQPNVCPARGMYGVDILLRKNDQGLGGMSIQPILLEVQWGADATKALEFHESFWDDVLEYLYVDSDTLDSESIPICMVDISVPNDNKCK